MNRWAIFGSSLAGLFSKAGQRFSSVRDVERALQPSRAKKNSPAIHRWESEAKWERVPSGTKEHVRMVHHFFRRWGFAGFDARFPSDESLGYFRSSLTGLFHRGAGGPDRLVVSNDAREWRRWHKNIRALSRPDAALQIARFVAERR